MLLSNRKIQFIAYYPILIIRYIWAKHYESKLLLRKQRWKIIKDKVFAIFGSLANVTFLRAILFCAQPR